MEQEENCIKVSDEDINLFRTVCLWTFKKYFMSYINYKDDMVSHCYIYFLKYCNKYSELKCKKITYFFLIARCYMLNYLKENKLINRNYERRYEDKSINEPLFEDDCECLCDVLADDSIDFNSRFNLDYLKSICNDVMRQMIVTRAKNLKPAWQTIYQIIKTYIKIQNCQKTAEIVGCSKQYVFEIIKVFREKLRERLKKEYFN